MWRCNELIYNHCTGVKSYQLTPSWMKKRSGQLSLKTCLINFISRSSDKGRRQTRSCFFDCRCHWGIKPRSSIVQADYLISIIHLNYSSLIETKIRFHWTIDISGKYYIKTSADIFSWLMSGEQLLSAHVLSPRDHQSLYDNDYRILWSLRRQID